MLEIFSFAHVRVPIFLLGWLIFYYWVLAILYVIWIQAFCRIHVSQIFLFIFMIISSEDKKKLMLKVAISYFYFTASPFYIIFNKYLVSSRSWSFPFVFSRKFRVLTFTFRYMVYFKLNFVYNIIFGWYLLIQ